MNVRWSIWLLALSLNIAPSSGNALPPIKARIAPVRVTPVIPLRSTSPYVAAALAGGATHALLSPPRTFTAIPESNQHVVERTTPVTAVEHAAELLKETPESARHACSTRVQFLSESNGNLRYVPCGTQANR